MLDYLRRFGLPRRPHWVVYEVEPPIDALNYRPSSPWMIQLLPVPIVLEWVRRFYGIRSFFSGDPIYPLAVDLPGRTHRLTCCVHYLDALTLTAQDWRRSRGWREFSLAVVRLSEEADTQGACTALLWQNCRARSRLRPMPCVTLRATCGPYQLTVVAIIASISRPLAKTRPGCAGYRSRLRRAGYRRTLSGRCP